MRRAAWIILIAILAAGCSDKGDRSAKRQPPDFRPRTPSASRRRRRRSRGQRRGRRSRVRTGTACRGVRTGRAPLRMWSREWLRIRVSTREAARALPSAPRRAARNAPSSCARRRRTGSRLSAVASERQPRLGAPARRAAVQEPVPPRRAAVAPQAAALARAELRRGASRSLSGRRRHPRRAGCSMSSSYSSHTTRTAPTARTHSASPRTRRC